MGAFYGTETYAIDHKGRIAIPLALRRRRGKAPLRSFFLIAGFEGCLALYPPDEWGQVERRLRTIPMGGSKGRKFLRTFLMNVSEVSVDGQGRITIPPALLGRAGLGKEAVLHGLVDRIEIWAPDRLEAEIKDADIEALAEEVLGGGNGPA